MLAKKRMENSTRNGVLVVALVLFVVALIIRFITGGKSLANEVVAQLKEFGCVISAEDLYQESYSKHSSIEELMQSIDMSEAVAVSREVGLPSDIGHEGEIYLLLAQLDDEKVLTVFVVNERVELAFIQKLGSEEIAPITESNIK